MKCQKCNQREANTHIQKIVNGKKTEYHLCSKCAAETGELKFSINGDFDDFFGGFFGKGANLFSAPSDKVCGVCHMKLSEFLKHGKLGCSNCYTEFSSSLSKPLKQIHGQSTHTGKIPKRCETEISREAKIRRLQSELEAAVLNQEFEMAAKLRDEINALKEGGEK